MEQKKNWTVLEDKNVIHVLPNMDIKPHGFSKDGKSAVVSDFDCPCKPKINASGKKPLIVHNSFEDMKKIDDSINNLTKE